MTESSSTSDNQTDQTEDPYPYPDSIQQLAYDAERWARLSTTRVDRMSPSSLDWYRNSPVSHLLRSKKGQVTFAKELAAFLEKMPPPTPEPEKPLDHFGPRDGSMIFTLPKDVNLQSVGPISEYSTVSVSAEGEVTASPSSSERADREHELALLIHRQGTCSCNNPGRRDRALAKAIMDAGWQPPAPEPQFADPAELFGEDPGDIAGTLEQFYPTFGSDNSQSYGDDEHSSLGVGEKNPVDDNKEPDLRAEAFAGLKAILVDESAPPADRVRAAELILSYDRN